jgi:hypothetical protein
MKFDINQTVNDMLAAMKGVVADNWDEVKTVAGEFLKRRKDRLQMIAELRISGELSQEKFESRLNDEKLIAEAELNAIGVISKAIAQKAVNAAMDVLTKTVKGVIDVAL